MYHLAEACVTCNPPSIVCIVACQVFNAYLPTFCNSRQALKTDLSSLLDHHPWLVGCVQLAGSEAVHVCSHLVFPSIASWLPSQPLPKDIYPSNDCPGDTQNIHAQLSVNLHSAYYVVTFSSIKVSNSLATAFSHSALPYCAPEQLI